MDTTIPELEFLKHIDFDHRDIRRDLVPTDLAVQLTCNLGLYGYPTHTVTVAHDDDLVHFGAFDEACDRVDARYTGVCHRTIPWYIHTKLTEDELIRVAKACVKLPEDSLLHIDPDTQSAQDRKADRDFTKWFFAHTSYAV